VTLFSAVRRLAHLPHLLILDSAVISPKVGRYSFVTADPFAKLWSRGKTTVFSQIAPQPGSRRKSHEVSADPFAVLATQLSRFQLEKVAGLPPFQSGAAGLFGYDLCHHLERLPRPRVDEFQLPDLVIGFYDWVAAFDHISQQAWLIATGLPAERKADQRWFAEKRLTQIRQLLSGNPLASRQLSRDFVQPARPYTVPGFQGLLSNFDSDGYKSAVRRAIEYIHAGDCFQINLAQRLLFPANGPPLELYFRSRERNPAPFSGFYDLGDYAIVSASPERFLRVDHGVVETRPIKGTRPRGSTPELDKINAAELLASAKDRAENVMIIDLMRNDLGRVCSYGSVEVRNVCSLESFQTVHHLVSEVGGRLRPGLGPVDLLKATFPGGSVTGAPKVRAMEIIAELEGTTRGPYCGCLGYIGFDGSMDTNLLIRSFTIGRGWAQFPVGGGIVADSTPEGEYA
ncbi:MAG: anthranilate synthase component I family protein, partial [Candidatus Acidiferrum sp.]